MIECSSYCFCADEHRPVSMLSDGSVEKYPSYQSVQAISTRTTELLQREVEAKNLSAEVVLLKVCVCDGSNDGIIPQS